jgi:uncharacterized protein (TIGR02217 family)
MSFHEVQFPPKLSLGVKGGPERRTDIVVLGSGFEERNSRWADSKRSYNVGYAITDHDSLYEVIEFYEERRGRLHGFRWKDWNDYKSCPPKQTPTNADQNIGTGTGALATFQLKKTYGSVYNPYTRDIKKPVSGTVLVAVNGVAKTLTTHYTLDTATGIITFTMGNLPANGHAVTAGFEFDVPVRFDTDKLELNLDSILHGSIPDIPVVEIRV